MLATIEEAINITDRINQDKDDAKYYLLKYEQEYSTYINKKQEYLTYKEEVDENVGGGKSNITGNPTERVAMKSIEFDNSYEPYKWLKAVEIVQRSLGERKNIFIKVRREADKVAHISKGRKGWIVFVQRRYAEEMEKRFIQPVAYMSERTLQSWWYDIINQVIFVQNKINF